MTVQEKLKKLRKEKHFSDKDVAEILGMRLNAYSMLEHGVVKLGSFLKNKLGLLYDKDPDYFVDDPEVEPEPEPEPEPELEEEIMVEAEIEPEPEISEEIMGEAEVEPEPEPMAETEIELENIDEGDLDAEITDEPDVELDNMAEFDLESEITAEVDVVPEIEAEREISEEIMPEVEIEPEPTVEPVTEPEPVKETPEVEPNHFVPESKKVEVGTIEFQYAGKAVSLSDIIDRTKEACGDEAVDLNIYIKPEENRVYFVSGNHTGNFEM